jgi:hypothetical protein
MEEPLLAPTGVDYEGIRTIQDYCHQQSRARGFHDEPDRLMELVSSLKETDTKLADYIYSMYLGNRLMLIVGEASEAHEEERKGIDPTVTYYPTKPDDDRNYQLGAFKPEGVPSELADIYIRLMDHAGELKVDMADAVKEKLEYNATRAYLHGKKF